MQAEIKLRAYTPDPDRICAEAAAICVDGKPSEKALRTALKSGHESVAEHASFTFIIENVSRVYLAQQTRHRIASYSVESERYVDIDKQNFLVPPSFDNTDLIYRVVEFLADARSLYDDLLEAGVKMEDARYILPQGITTKMMITMNGRELRHFFSLRQCNRAQKEIRYVADRMHELVSKVAPVLFEDAGPGCVRGDCPEARPCGHPRAKE